MIGIAELRARTGLSFRGLAALSGTSAATLHAYEHDRVSPTWATLERIARNVGLEPTIEFTPSLPPWAYPVGSLVTDLATAPERDRLRHVVEFADRWAETPQEQRSLLVAADPGSTGAPPWDALVAGLVEHLTWHAGLAAPRWCGAPSRFLDRRWWPVDLPSLRARSLAETPAAFERRGVMLARSTFERA